jgi:putative flippase GtrA
METSVKSRNSIRDRFMRPIKFILVGGIGALLQLLLLAALVTTFRINEALLQNIANAVAIFLAAEIVFPLHRQITWSDRKEVVSTKGLLKQLWVYNTTRTAAWGVQGFSFLLANLFVGYFVAGVVSNLVSAVVNYFASDKLVFTRRVKE